MKPFHVSFLIALALTAPKVGWGQDGWNAGAAGTLTTTLHGSSVKGTFIGQNRFLRDDGTVMQILNNTEVRGQNGEVGIVTAAGIVPKREVQQAGGPAGTPAPAPAPKPPVAAPVAPAAAVQPPVAGAAAPAEKPADPARQDAAPAPKEEAKKEAPKPELTDAQKRAAAKTAAEKAFDEAKQKISDRVTRAKDEVPDLDCVNCGTLDATTDVQQVAIDLSQISDLDAALQRKLEKDLETARKEAIADLTFAGLEAQLKKAEEKVSTRGAQSALDEIERIVDRAKVGKSEADQKKFAEFCVKAASATRRIGRDAFKEEKDEDDDSDDSLLGRAGNFLASAGQQLGGMFGFTGRADLDEDSELDVESDDTGAAAYRAAGKILESCEEKVTFAKVRKGLKNKRYRLTEKMFDHLATLGPNAALNYYQQSLMYRGGTLNKEWCRGRSSQYACWMLAARAAGAQKDAIAYEKGRAELFKASFTARDINLGTNTPSVVKDASGNDITFPGMTDFNNRLIQGTVPAENPLTKPSLDATVTPPVFSTGLALPVVGGRT